MAELAKKILKKHDLRLTDSRLEILDIFLNRKFAISHAFIEEFLKSSHDRVTIYRTLYSFLEKGIIHKVLDEGGSTKYALCNDNCDIHHHHDNHVHFKCLVCGETTCIDNIHIPPIQLPSGYSAKETGILIQGVCVHCNH